MPIVDAKEGGQLDTSIAELLDAPTDRQEQLLRRMLVERLDFESTSGTVPIPSGRLTDLPDSAVRIASVGGIQVLLVTVSGARITATAAKAIIKGLANQVDEHLLVARTEDGALFHFIYPRSVGSRTVLKRIVLERGRPRRTAVGRLVVLYSDRADNGADARTAIEHAFDVEAVTREFYKGYEGLFQDIESEFLEQSGDATWAHDYALQLLNRVMFLYFIDRKGWMEPDFLKTFWRAYRQSGQVADSFFDKWLKVLFFEAFNNEFSHPSYMPQDIRDKLQQAPHLNGGLFRKNPRLDGVHKVAVTDELWRHIMEFFDSYNFTIAESTPWDQEVAVDPEMIGKVYESLVNVSEIDERGEAGIFYTPRTEIDLMGRLALVDYLANHLGEDRKSLLYNVVFAVEPDEKEDADRQLRDKDLWPEFDRLIQEITVVDPACGSGSFLVGMLQVLGDLFVRADRELGRQETAYERKTRIIGQSLYGVDVMEWAVDVAELRLWLQLVIDTDISWEERKLRPLLPNLSFKIRCGDSLVQEVGGVNMAHTHGRAELPAQVKGQLTKLKGEKLRYYNNEEGCPDQEELERRELELFRSVLDGRVATLRSQMRENQGRLEAARTEQGQLAGMARERGKQASLEEVRLLKELTRLESELVQARAAENALVSAGDVPFVWDIAFVEVFEGERQGFDIVIGNPPYVRQAKIADPREPPESATADSRKLYRTKLARSVYANYPSFFGPNPDDPQRKLDGKSDYYVYFYFQGLSLLNDQGSFCFITSNSWLDVGYGAELQEFLLKHCLVKMILDNEATRTFASADINTVIALVSAPVGRQPTLDHIAHFVMFKMAHEHVLSPVIFQEIEAASQRRVTPEYRVHSVSHEALLEDGLESPSAEGVDATTSGVTRASSGPVIKVARYVGNKWGGKYLRAPDIYFTIIDKGRDLIGPLGDYLEGERYLNTGGADGFFILDKVDPDPGSFWHVFNDNATRHGARPFDGAIEKEYLIPLVKDYTKSDKRIEIHGYDAYCLVVDDRPGPKVQRYIEWGEEQGYHQRSVTKNQRPWYKPTNQMKAAARLLMPRSFNDSFVIHHNPKGYLSLRFYRLHPKNGNDRRLAAYLNTTLVALVLETLGNKALGQGVLDFFMADFLALRIPIIQSPELDHAFQTIKERPILPVAEEYVSLRSPDRGDSKTGPFKDRQQLDDIVFDALGLTQGEREAVYEAVINQVEARLRKAQSLRSDT